MFKKFIKCCALFVGVSASAASTQSVVRSGELGGFKGDSRYFTGEVSVSMLFKSDTYRPFSGALVEFSPKARTAWHTHPAGQTLIVTKGQIYTATKNGVLQIANTGDVVLCPPDIKHFHGAGLETKAAHIALTAEKDGKNVTWMEHVSDEEYEKLVKQDKKD
ncbi:(R)-mandelonitrile lyase [Campylobacter fetus]|uniref:(R)-mandelonitrile lyase n=1 Tax=Campylobacter fetus TaxID=196 RepID=UPI000FCAE97F|nr:cupin domain-containing protein [Campylobacter fetus]